MRGLCARKSENGVFRCDTRLQIFLNDSKICEAEVTVTPLINKICKPCFPEHRLVIEPIARPNTCNACHATCTRVS